MPDENMFDIGARIKLEKDTEFRNAVTGINKSLNAMNAELKLVSAQYEGNANSLEALKAKQEVLNRILDEHKKKVAATNTALQNAKTQRNSLQETLEKNLQQFDEENAKLEELKKTYGDTSQEVKAQEKVLGQLELKINKGNSEYDKASNRINEWQAKLNTAEAQVIRATKAVNRNTAYMKEAEEATDQCAKSMDAFGNEIKKVEAKTNTFGDSVKANLAAGAMTAAADALKDIGSSAREGAAELEKAGNQIEASTNLTGKALQEYKEVLKSVYADNYGDNMEEVSEVLGKIKQNLGELDRADLQNVTESAIALRDTFDMDMNESIRGAKNLMYQFELSASEAFDLLGKGAREGLNYTDELGDNVSEYAGNFAQAGYSAGEYFQLLKNGAANGAYNLDKVNDAINEVTNRLADGTVEGALGSFSKETQNIFREWQQGGATQKQIIDSIVNDISTCTNEQQALTMAAAAFGTMGEDSNLKFVQSLTSVGDTFENVKGTMESIKDVKYDDLNSQLTEVTRTIQMQLGEQVKKFLPTAVDGLQLVSEHLVPIEAGLAGLSTSILLLRAVHNDTLKGAVKGIISYVVSLEGATAAAKAHTLASGAMSAVMSASPWTLLAVGIGAAAAAVTAFALASKKTKPEAKRQEQEVKDLAEAYEKLKEKIDESKAAFSENKHGTAVEAESIQVMSDKLYELAKSNGAANGKKAEMLAYINQLNEAIPGLNLALNEQTGELNKTKEVTNGYISSMKQSALENVYGERMKEIAAQIAEANAQIIEAEAKKAEIQPLVTEATRKQNEALKENGTAMAYAAAGAGGLNMEVSSLKRSYNQADAVIEENRKLIEGLEKEQNSLGEEMEATAKNMGLLTEETDRNTKAAKENALVAKEVAASADVQKDALDSLREKFEETKQSIENGIENKINLFDAFDGGDDLSVDSLAENMESHMEGLRNYKENLTKLKEDVGSTIAPEFMQYIEDMGIEGANLVLSMAEALDSEEGREKLKQASDNYLSYLDESDEIARIGASNKMALDASLGELGSSKADFSKLEESIKKASVSSAAGWSSLTEGTRQALEEIVQAAQECGVQIPEGLTEGIKSGEVAPEEVISQLKGSIQGQFEYFSEMAKDAGIQIPEDLKAGISQGGDAAVQAMTELYSLILNTQKESEKASEEAGKKNIQATGKGISQAGGEVQAEASGVMSQAVNTANSYYSGFYSVGKNLMSGTVSGIISGAPAVAAAAEKAVDDALNRVKKKAGVNSPSRVWRDQLGKTLAEGTALGIKEGTKAVQKSARDMADDSLNAVKDELEIHSPSGTFKREVGYRIAEGTAFGIKLKKKQAKKAAKEMAEEVADAAGKAFENYRKENVSKINATLDDEKYMWEKLVKKAKKGSKAYQKEIKKLAKEHLKEISQQRKAERLDAQETALDAYKTYYNVSPKAEMQYWDVMRREYKKGTDQRIEADKKYYEAKENYNEKLKDLEDEYYEKCKEVKEKLQDAFEERKDAIRSAYGIFDEFTSEAETPEKLLANMQSQVQGYALWMEELEKLEEKNVLNSAFLKELKEMGPDAAATILSLNMMSEEQLRLANEAYEMKNRLAEEQAARELEQMKKDTQEQLDDYKTAYLAAYAELNEEISEPLKRLAEDSYNSGIDAVASLVKGIKEKASAKETNEQLKGIQKQMAKGMNGLPKKGKAIGKDTLAGILKGLSNSLEIKKGAKSFVKELEEAIKEEAGIKSPSARFRDTVGVQIPAGVAEGIRSGTLSAARAGIDMVKEMVDKTKEQLQRQQETVTSYMAGINSTGGIAALGNLMTVPVGVNTNVTVNNSGVAEVVGTLAAEMKGMREDIRKMKVYLNDDTLVGGIAEKVGSELAMETRRW